MSWEKVNPVIDLSVRFLCLSRYPNHPHGCPNYEQRASCPPYCPTITEVLDLSQPVYAIWNEFDFTSHCERMKIKHPNWSKRQIECCLYWQSKARKQLRHQIDMFLSIRKRFIVEIPEACGVNVTETMKQIGINLEWPPITKTYQVVLAGTEKGGE